MTMIEMRGRNQFVHSTGRSLFLGAVILWVRPLRSINHTVTDNVSRTWQSLHWLSVITCPCLTTSAISFSTATLGNRPTFRLLPLTHRSIALRGSTLEALRSHEDPLDQSFFSSLSSQVEILDQEFLDWCDALPEYWVRRDHLYELLTFNIFRAHRVFLQDLKIRCHQGLDAIIGSNSEEKIAGNVNTSRALVDEICATMPYDFAADDPHARKEDVETAIVPKAEVGVFSHMSFS